MRLHARAPSPATPTRDAGRDVRGELKQAGFGPKIIDAQMANLQRGRRAPRVEGRRVDLVELRRARPLHRPPTSRRRRRSSRGATAALDAPMVLDLGANDGRFSRVAVEAGASLAVAVDGDHLVVDHLYRQLRAEGERRILPLVLDLADPSPGAGLAVPGAAVVRRPGAARPRALPGGHPPPRALRTPCRSTEIVAFLHDFGATLVVEMPHRDDPMAARLLARKRAGVFDHYDRPQWEAALGQRLRCARAGDPPLGHPHAVPLPPPLTAPLDSVEAREAGDEGRQHLADRAGEHGVGQVVHGGGRSVHDHDACPVGDGERDDLRDRVDGEGGADGEQEVAGTRGGVGTCQVGRAPGSDRS